MRPLSAIARVTAWRIHQAIVELLDCADQSQRALLNQVKECQTAAEVAFRDGDDEAQVGLDHLLLGGHVATLDPLCQRHLLLGVEQVDATDRAQVKPQRVEARLDGEIDLGPLALLGARLGRVRGGRLDRAWLRSRRPTVLLLHDVDSLLVEIRVQLLELLLCHLDLFQVRSDLIEGQKAAIVPFGDQRAQLFDLADRSLIAQQNRCFIAHWPLSSLDVRTSGGPGLGPAPLSTDDSTRD